MGLALHGATVDGDDRITIWVADAESLFKRLRAGESYTMQRPWDGAGFELVDPCGTHVVVAEAPAPQTVEFEVRLDTDEFEFEERSEWYAKLGFVETDERDTDDGAERVLEAGPLTLVLHEAQESSPVVFEND